MAKGYVKWVCKVEGKEVPSVAASRSFEGTHCVFPGNIYNEEALFDVIDIVSCLGVGEQLSGEQAIWVDIALEWSSHPLEDQWGAIYDGEFISQEIYECCVWMQANWEHRDNPDYQWDEDDQWAAYEAVSF